MRQQIWGEVVDFILAFFQFIWECNSENIIKIGPYLPKLLQEKFGTVFLAHPVYLITLFNEHNKLK